MGAHGGHPVRHISLATTARVERLGLAELDQDLHTARARAGHDLLLAGRQQDDGAEAAAGPVYSFRTAAVDRRLLLHRRAAGDVVLYAGQATKMSVTGWSRTTPPLRADVTSGIQMPGSPRSSRRSPIPRPTSSSRSRPRPASRIGCGSAARRRQRLRERFGARAVLRQPSTSRARPVYRIGTTTVHRVQPGSVQRLRAVGLGLGRQRLGTGRARARRSISRRAAPRPSASSRGRTGSRSIRSCCRPART